MEQEETSVQAKPRDFEPPPSANEPDPIDEPASAPPPHSFDGDDSMQQAAPPTSEEAQD